MKHILTTMWENYWLHAKSEIQAILLQSIELMPITPSFWESVVNHIISCVPPPFKRCLSNLTYFVFHKSYITLFPYVLLSPFSPPLPPPCYQSSIYEVTSKVVCLFCFVLFVALRSTKHTLMSFVTLFITLESLRWVGVHRVGFIIFQPIVEKLLNIEQFVFHWKFL